MHADMHTDPLQDPQENLYWDRRAAEEDALHAADYNERIAIIRDCPSQSQAINRLRADAETSAYDIGRKAARLYRQRVSRSDHAQTRGDRLLSDDQPRSRRDR